MTLSKAGNRSLPWIPVLYGLILLAVLFYAVFWIHRSPSNLAPFWDARVYRLALETWRQGHNPYTQAGKYVEHLTFLFVSPPIFLGLMELTRHLVPGSFGFHVYVAASILCTLSVPAILVWCLLQRTWMSAPLALAIFAFCPNHHGVQALLTGNASNIMYAAVLCALGWGLRKQRWLPFYLCLVLTGLLKPMFLSFLLLPLLAAGESLLPSLAVGAIVLGGYLWQRVQFPVLFQAFQQNVRTQVFLRGDTGFGLLTYIARYLHHLPLIRRLGPSLSDALLIAVLVCGMFLLRMRYPSARMDRLWTAAVLVLAFLSNPRIQAYDADIALVPAVFIVVTFFKDLPATPWRPFWIGIPLVLFITLVSFEADLATCVLLLSSVILVMARVAFSRFFQRPQSFQDSSFEGAPGSGSLQPAP